MTTSGSYNFSVNRNEIINLAGSGAGIKGIGRVLSSDDIDTASQLLNLIVKQWMGRADFAPGLKVWTRKRAYLFPELGEQQYTLGPGGDHATASYGQTTLLSSVGIGNQFFNVPSTTGMTAGDNVGFICNDGSIFWSTILDVLVAQQVTITTQIPSAASAGNTVYWYTSKIMLPLEMISVRRKNTSGSETTLTRMSLHEYEEGLLKKDNDGDPSRYIYERGITTGTLTFDYEIEDTTEVILLTFLRPVEDFDAATDTPDYPQEWFRPLVGQLMVDWATFAGKVVTQEMKDYRNEALMIAGNLDPDQDTEGVFFMGET